MPLASGFGLPCLDEAKPRKIIAMSTEIKVTLYCVKEAQVAPSLWFCSPPKPLARQKIIAMSTEIKVTLYCAAKEGWGLPQAKGSRPSACLPHNKISHLGRKEGNPANISSFSDL